MIDIDEIKRDSPVWVVSQQIEEMIYPTKAKYLHRESDKGRRLAFVYLRQKKVCYPTHLIFNTEKEALIYSSINFLKMYYGFDPFFVSENVDDEVLLDAYALVEKYEEEDPSMFLYHWMGDVPNR